MLRSCAPVKLVGQVCECISALRLTGGFPTCQGFVSHLLDMEEKQHDSCLPMLELTLVGVSSTSASQPGSKESSRCLLQ